MREGKILGVFQAASFCDDVDHIFQILNATIENRPFYKLRLIGVAPGAGNDQRQGHFAFGKVVTDIFTEILCRSLIVQNIIYQLEGKADMAEMAWMTNDPDTLPFLALRTEAWPEAGGFNSGYYSNPEVDTLLAQARTSTDQAERATLYKQMQEIVYEDAPWLFVANWKQNAVTRASVENFSLQPSFFLMLQDVAKPN